MGKHLVSLLEGTEHEVIVTTRAEHPDRNNIKYVRGNAHDLDFISPLLSKGADVIVNFMVYNTQAFTEVVDTLLGSCGQYIHLSSARVYSDADEVITEKTPRLLDICMDDVYLATDEYALTKARQENVLFASKRNNYTIIRPYITYSEKRLQLGVNEKETWLYRALRGHSIVFSEDIASKYTTLTYGKDVARGIMALFGRDEALGEAFHITASENILWRDVLSLYCDVMERVLGKRPRVSMQEFSPNLLGGGKWQVKCDRWYNRKFDNTKINKFIDTSSFVSPRTGLEACLTRFLANPQFGGINWRKEAQLDRLSRELYPPFTQRRLKDTLKYFLFRTVLKER